MLKPYNENLFPNLLDDYLLKKNKKEPEPFWNNVCTECIPHFIGVWDTVKSLGHIFGRRFFDQNEYSKLYSKISYACHAVSIDEKRKHFLPQLWDKNGENQEIKQVYFSGCHSDVGGWHIKSGLSDTTLNWMLENAKKARIQIDKQLLNETIHPNPNGELHQSKNCLWMLGEILDPRKWKKPNKRKILANDRIHSSVKKRLNSLSYFPDNLPDHRNFGDHLIEGEIHA